MEKLKREGGSNNQMVQDLRNEIERLNGLLKECLEDCDRYKKLIEQLTEEKLKLEQDNAFYRN